MPALVTGDESVAEDHWWGTEGGAQWKALPWQVQQCWHLTSLGVTESRKAVLPAEDCCHVTCCRRMHRSAGWSPADHGTESKSRWEGLTKRPVSHRGKRQCTSAVGGISALLQVKTLGSSAEADISEKSQSRSEEKLRLQYNP